jgi:hypothetical protein
VRLGVGQVQRQGERGDRDEQRGDGQGEEQLRAAEAEPGETVPGEGGQGGRADAAEHRVQRRVAEPLDVGPVAVDVLEQQREVVEELERPGEPESERLEDVRLVLGRVDRDPGDRDQGEDREQEREHGQQRDRAPAQPVEFGRDDRVLFLQPLPPAPLPPRFRSSRRPSRSRRRSHRYAHANSLLRRRKMSDTDEMTTMITARITAMAAARLVSSAAIAVFHM